MAQTLRPLSVFETIDAAFSLYRKHFKDLIIIAAIILIPLGIISYLVQLPTIELQNTAATFDPNSGELPDFNFGGFFGGIFLTLILTIVGTAILTGSATNVVASSYLDRLEGWQESMSEAFSKVGKLVGSSLLLAIGASIAAIFCIAPGVYLYISWVTAPVTIMVEDEGAAGSLGRSRDLVSGRWWSVFGVILIMVILQIIISLVLGAVVGAGSFFSGPTELITSGDIALSTVASTISQILIAPFTAVVITVVYFDLRVRKEGFDLDQLARRMGHEPPPLGGGPAPTDPGPVNPPPPPPPSGGDPFA